MEITALLKKDHREVEAMFEEFEGLSDRAIKTKLDLAARICRALEVHTQIEERLFYPELEKHRETEDLAREAVVEHNQVKSLITKIKTMEPDDALFDPRMKVLRELVQQHVNEEESELFPAARDAIGDEFVELGEEATRMKERLQPESPEAAAADELQPEA